MVRVLNFNDTFSSATEPSTVFTTSGSVGRYADDAAYETALTAAGGTLAGEVSSGRAPLYYNTTINDLKWYDGSIWRRNESELNNSTTSDPTVSDDSDDGYAVLSSWLNTSTGVKFVCTDATVGAAVWQEVSFDSQFDPSTGHDHDGVDSRGSIRDPAR